MKHSLLEWVNCRKAHSKTAEYAPIIFHIALPRVEVREKLHLYAYGSLLSG